MLTNKQRREIRRWMLVNREDHVDDCGELNCTSLVENCILFGPDCCDVGWLYDDTHEIWCVAVEFSDPSIYVF